MPTPRNAVPASLVLAAALALPACAQTPAADAKAPPPAAAPSATSPAAEDLASLAARVEKAHLPGGKVEPVTAFHGHFLLRVVATKEKQRGEAELEVKFLQQKREGSERPRSLLHVRLIDANKPVQHGNDEFGMWALIDGRVHDVPSRGTEQDAEAVQRDLALARQMLRFLDAGAVLRSLASPSPVRTEELRVGREEEATKCFVVEGELPSFPLRASGGEDAPVRAKIWVTEAEGRLLAVEAFPLGKDGAPDRAHGEFLRLLEPKVQDGILLPRLVEHFAVGEDGLRHVQFEVLITTLDLRPKLTAKDLERPR